MNFLIKTVSIAAVLFLFADLISTAEEKTCKGIVSDLTKRQMGGIATCSKGMTFKNGKEKAAKMNCILRCVMIKEGLLAADGTMPNETYEAFLKKEFPESLMPVVRPLFGNCKDTQAQNIDPKEEYCKSYDGFIKCLLGALGTMCK